METPNSTNSKLIKEEQIVLNTVIESLERQIGQNDIKIQENITKAKAARDSGVPEAYGTIVAARHEKSRSELKVAPFKKARKELFENHLIIENRIGDNTETLDLKVGRTTCLDSDGKPIIVDYRESMVFPFIGADYLEESTFEDNHYQLISRVKDTIQSDTIVDAVRLFSQQNKFYDSFLDELLLHRHSPELQNIIFSIKKKQKEIIQAKYGTNIIVQGCAGSGKSMIMFHRLPFILFHNHTSFNLKNVFVVTPSVAYMKMVYSMLEQLEIEDVQMGTMEDYFDMLAYQYPCKPKYYRREKVAKKIPASIEKTIYSKGFFEQIEKSALEHYKRIENPCQRGASFYGIRTVFPQKNSIAADIIQKRYIAGEILDRQKERINQYKNDLFKASKVLKDLHTMLCYRKSEMQRKINNLDKTSYTEKESLALKDDKYFQFLFGLGQEIESFFKELGINIKLEKEFSDDLTYLLIPQKKKIEDYYDKWMSFFKSYQDPYFEYGESFLGFLKKSAEHIYSLKKNNKAYLSERYVKRIKYYLKDLNDFTNNKADQIYRDALIKIGLANEKNEIPYYRCSPYVFLMSLYCCHGPLMQNEERYVFIDEAQNWTRQELNLIRIVHGNKVVFNLYGDINQHIEGNKGVENWDDLCDTKDFELYSLEENYRNAVPITEFCNKNLNLRMQAICVDGPDVFETDDASELHSIIVDKLKRKHNGKANAIIIKDLSNAKKVIGYLNSHQIPFKNQLFSSDKVDVNKWNLFSVDDARGLEFQRVFVVRSGMTRNERYIAYTRAQDELFIYSGLFET